MKERNKSDTRTVLAVLHSDAAALILKSVTPQFQGDGSRSRDDEGGDGGHAIQLFSIILNVVLLNVLSITKETNPYPFSKYSARLVP